MFRRCCRRLVVRTLPDNTKLDGTFHPTVTNRLLSGVAVLPDGRCFKGTFDESTGAPKAGTQLEEDGDLYVGAFNTRWQRSGEGEAWLADGTRYKGTFEDDELVRGEVRVPSGVTELIFNGTLKDEEFVHGTLQQSDFTYTGDFQGNRPHGKGKIEFSNGATQEGTFHNGSLHGDNCTMKLEGGFVYVGSFVEGKILRGMLYTATYTYDGEFSEQGKAHGEGTQIHLASSPKLTFTGIWHHGNLTRGTCVDEFGSPVDWQDRHDIQEQLLEESGTPGGVQAQKLVQAKLKEADSMFRDYQRSYTADADKVQQESGTRPSMMDLGYEHSMRTERSAMEKSAVLQKRATADAMSDDAFLDDANTPRPELEADVKNHLVNEDLVKSKLREQVGSQRLMQERMNEQLGRFLNEQQNPPQKRGLNIDSNATWKGFTSK